MPAISDNVGMDIETAYDLISFFHQYKPVNVTWSRNPTVVNGSWVISRFLNNASNINYKFTGITSTFVTNTLSLGALWC